MLTNKQLVYAAAEYGTPTYIFDVDELTERMQSIRAIAGEDIGICFAMKANPFLVHYMKSFVDRFEVCSPGEFAICEHERVNMQSIVLSGVYKNINDIAYAMRLNDDIGIYTIESTQQWQMLSECAKQIGKKISVLLRLTSGNQFGLDVTDIGMIISTRANHPHINIVGIQYFSGTQKKSMEQMAKEIEEIDKFCNYLHDEYRYKAEEIEYGPGLPIEYFSEEAREQNFSKLEQLLDLLIPIRKKYKITLEIGRYLTATCGIYLSRIADLKINKDHGYCIIDGGIHHINYYGQMLALKVPKVDLVKNMQARPDSDIKEWTVCGALCTVNDILLKKYPIENPSIGVLFIFHNLGAYSITETGYLFLSREMPLVLAAFPNGSEEVKIEILRDRMKTDIINSRQLSR